MKGSAFASTFPSFAAWESSAVSLEASGENIPTTFVQVTLSHPDGRSAIIDVASDYFSVGEADDFLRLPLTPTTAQRVANLKGMLLPTPKLVYTIWQQSNVKLTPVSIAALKPAESNKGANMAQYLRHNAAIQAQLAGQAGLISGHKKDVVVGNIAKPGKVLIFGWYRPSPDVFDDRTAMENPKRQPTQPYSNVHGDFYVDYSHGIRFVSPLMTVEGKEMETEKVYTDSKFSGFISHEGPVRQPRYPAPFPNGTKPPVASAPRAPGKLAVFTGRYPSYVDLGTEVLIANSKRAES